VRRLPEVLTTTEALALFAGLTNGATGLRNRVAVALMYRSGLRVGEVCALAPKDIELHEGVLRIWRGKGRKDRTVYLDEETCELVRRWLPLRPKTSRYLLPVLRAGRRGLGESRPGGPLSPRYLEALVARLAREAEIPKRVTPHTLRHTYATEAVKAGVPLHEVQADLGHQDLKTTQVYLHVWDSERQERARKRPPIGLV